MSIPEIILYALIAITFLYLMVVLARRRVRAATRVKTRRDLLDRTIDPTRSGATSLDEAENGRDRQA